MDFPVENENNDAVNCEDVPEHFAALNALDSPQNLDIGGVDVAGDNLILGSSDEDTDTPNDPNLLDELEMIPGYKIEWNAQSKIPRCSLAPLCSHHGEHNVTEPMESGASCLQALKRVVEFRSDITLGAVFQEAHQPSYPKIFHATNPLVFTSAESIVHYINHPYVYYRNGNPIEGIAHLPLAQHVCICMDDGIQRYKSIIRISFPDPKNEWRSKFSNTDPYNKVISWTVPSRGTEKSTFKRALRDSLMEMIRPYSSEKPFELYCLRPDRMYVVMRLALRMFFTTRDPIHTRFFPIIRYAHQSIKVNLLGSQFSFTGTLYCPYLAAATFLLKSGNFQVMDTIEVTIRANERCIYGFSLDTTIACENNENGQMSLDIIDSVLHLFETKSWGPEMVDQNTLVPPQVHPFKNLEYNPFMNSQFNPYKTFYFVIPEIQTHTGQNKIPQAFTGSDSMVSQEGNYLEPMTLEEPESAFSAESLNDEISDKPPSQKCSENEEDDMEHGAEQ